MSFATSARRSDVSQAQLRLVDDRLVDGLIVIFRIITFLTCTETALLLNSLDTVCTELPASKLFPQNKK